MTKRSDQEIPLGRRSARVARIDGVAIAAEMLENPLNRRRLLDAYMDAPVCQTTFFSFRIRMTPLAQR
jgi:hypothetical protein